MLYKTFTDILSEYDELIEESSEHEDDTSENIFFHEVLSDNTKFNSILQKLLAKDEIVVEYIESFGGEGSGDDYWTVYKISDATETTYIRFQGWYASYHGAEFTETQEVKPIQVTVTQYELVS